MTNSNTQDLTETTQNLEEEESSDDFDDEDYHEYYEGCDCDICCEEYSENRFEVEQKQNQEGLRDSFAMKWQFDGLKNLKELTEAAKGFSGYLETKLNEGWVLDLNWGDGESIDSGHFDICTPECVDPRK